jgi:antitoxin component YwqK of YwqJK toxin-antitoxin module
MYCCTWKNNKYHEYGIVYYENGNIKYKGEFQNGCCHGNGILYYDNGDIHYNGKMSNGFFNDIGILYENEKIKYDTDIIIKNIDKMEYIKL